MYTCMLSPVSWKCVYIVRQIKTKTRGIDPQKMTGARVGVHIARSFRVHDTHLPHNPNPTNRVAYTRHNQFLPIEFLFLLGALFIRTSTDRVGVLIGSDRSSIRNDPPGDGLFVPVLPWIYFHC